MPHTTYTGMLHTELAVWGIPFLRSARGVWIGKRKSIAEDSGGHAQRRKDGYLQEEKKRCKCGDFYEHIGISDKKLGEIVGDTKKNANFVFGYDIQGHYELRIC